MDVYVLLQATFATVLVSSGYVTARWGGTPERIGVALIAACSVLTVAVSALPGLNGPNALGVLIVDLLLLAGLLSILLKTDRFWPIWTCGFQLVAVATHLVMLAFPDIVPLAYKLVRGAWAYPMLGVIVLAALNPWAPMRKSAQA